MQNTQYRWMKVQWQTNNIVFNKKDRFRKIPLAKRMLFLLHFFWFATRNSFQKINWCIKIYGVFLIPIEIIWTLEQSWLVSSLEWDLYTIVTHEWARTCQISRQINSAISAGWPLQKEGNNDSKAEILRNLNHCPCPALKGMQKKRHSVDVSALYLEKGRHHTDFLSCVEYLLSQK